MKDTNFKKTGYELRTDLLGMAMSLLRDRQRVMLDNEHLKPESKRAPIKPFTTEDVVLEAEKLYTFVQKNQ